MLLVQSGKLENGKKYSHFTSKIVAHTASCNIDNVPSCPYTAFCNKEHLKAAKTRLNSRHCYRVHTNSGQWVCCVILEAVTLGLSRG